MREKWRGSLKDGEEWLMCILREGEIIWVFFFGFVRYTGIKDEEWLEKQLRNVWCG